MILSFSARKLGVISLVVVCSLVLCLFMANISRPVQANPSLNMTIVIDAGHGGMDGGCTTDDEKYKESDINLEYSKTLEKLLTQAGFNVVQTRKTTSGLYKNFGTNYKDEDMQVRKGIIDKADPVLVISMHTNYFTDISQKGAQSFYQKGDEKSSDLARLIQDQFVNQLGSTRSCLSGDYYICKCNKTLSVITECGFLSNDEDVKKITSEDYREKYCYAVACGIIGYLITPTNMNTENLENFY